MRSIDFPDADMPTGLEALKAGLTEDNQLTALESRFLTILFRRYSYHGGRGDLIEAVRYFKGPRKAEFIAAYDQTQEKKRLADLRVQLKKLVGNRCPSCGGSRPGELDHHLPKKRYPEYAVLPMNLIACCGECNKRKSQTVGAGPEEAYLHPYFDKVPPVAFMQVALDVQPHHIKALLTFDDAAVIADHTLKARMKHQFGKIDLNARVESDVTEYITERSGILDDEYGDAPDPALVKATILKWALRADKDHTVGSWVLRAAASSRTSRALS